MFPFRSASHEAAAFSSFGVVVTLFACLSLFVLCFNHRMTPPVGVPFVCLLRVLQAKLSSPEQRTPDKGRAGRQAQAQAQAHAVFALEMMTSSVCACQERGGRCPGVPRWPNSGERASASAGPAPPPTPV